MNLSGNQKGDVAVQTKLLEVAIAFVQSREVTVEMKEMNFYTVLPDSFACKLLLWCVCLTKCLGNYNRIDD